MNLKTPVENIQYIGTVYQKRLAKLKIHTVEDLLTHLPTKYEDFSVVANLCSAEKGQNTTIRAKVIKIENKRIFKKKMVLTEAVVQDGEAKAKVIWFNQPYLLNSVKEDEEFFFSGKIDIRNKWLTLTNPVVEKAFSKSAGTHTGRMIPIYPETRGVTSKWIRFVIKNLLERIENPPEILPEEIIKEQKLLTKAEALKKIHFPDNIDDTKEARRRIAFEQIYLIQTTLLEEKIRISRENAVSIPINVDILKRLVGQLPFKLTDSQRKTSWQILKDMEKKYPMNRLLEGDVGSGKTVVAAIAIANTTRAKFQSALMVPTEVLAKQHFKEVFNLLKSSNINIGLLTGKEDKFYSKKLKSDFIEISRKKLLEKVVSGDIDLLIGTHALIQDKVKFNNLALVILDEQHRFGVKQRAKLVSRNKATDIRIPHLLSMTATPIPRTLALSIYGDLDLSLITQLPKGRKKISTKMVFEKDRVEVYSFVKKQVQKGKQVFVICPRIDPDEDKEEGSRWANVKAVKEEHERLQKEIFPKFNIGIIHGKMGIKDKERTMRDFKNKKIDILVSTSVIEVGIDVPNATVMIIEGAERFGLAQLHQFRGRVGRSKSQSYCFLFPESFSPKTKSRMTALLSSADGFSLAEQDLKLRGAGDFLGKRQWGLTDIAMDSLANIKLVQLARESAIKTIEKDVSLRRHPLLKSKVNELRKVMHLE
ncbi:MAG: ATP-dependent DNA helicase RecG [Candidatus Pacebacteria bacterium]|nr:ATP-dependent DNA helicase RecG [Candidatus Paceibacterota bacterium]